MTDRALRGYTTGLTLIGILVTISICWHSIELLRAPMLMMAGPLLLAVMTVFMGAWVMTVRNDDDGEEDRISTSTAYAVALTMSGPLVLAILAHIVSIAIEQKRNPRPLRRALFNASQYVLAASFARLTFIAISSYALTDFYSLTLFSGALDLLAGVVAGVVYFASNYLMVTVAVCLANQLDIRQVVASSFKLYLPLSLALACLGPIVAVLLDVHVLALPLALLPPAIVRYALRMIGKHQHRALHDVLTSLPNRAFFTRRLRHRLDSAGQEHVTAMMLDLDHFKEINDTLGHAVGDDLLRVVAHRLRSSVAESVEIFRLGGDEFAVLIPHGSDLQDCQVAEALLASLVEPISVDGIDVTAHASIGIAYYPDHAQTPSDLMRCADVALYQAKENSKGDVQIYSAVNDSSDRSRLTLATDLHHAVAAGQISTYFQPQIDSATHDLIGFEALSRWFHPGSQRMIGPDIFIPIAESTGLIAEMTRSMISDSLTMLAQLNDPKLTISVNISPRLLSNTEMTDWISSALEQTGVCPDQLVIEVTESTLMADPERAIEVMARLRAAGVQLAIDDFGTGYSSMGYLPELQPNEIKIDKKFVQSIDRKQGLSIVRATINMAHDFDCRVVAEGVEDAATADRLHQLGSEVLQGYHFAKPMPRTEIFEWVPRHRLTHLEQRRSQLVF